MSKAELIKVSKVGKDKLQDYADAWVVLSQVFPSRGARAEASEKLAKKLGITVSGLNRTIKPDFKRPERQREITKNYVENTEHKIALLKACLSVIGSGERPEDAAEYCGSSARTVYRNVEKLLKPSVLDLRDVNLDAFRTLRSQLADEIEAKHMPKLLETLRKREEKAGKEQENRKRTQK